MPLVIFFKTIAAKSPLRLMESSTQLRKARTKAQLCCSQYNLLRYVEEALRGCRLQFLNILNFRDLKCFKDILLINLLGFYKSSIWFLWERKCIHPNIMDFWFFYRNLTSAHHRSIVPSSVPNSLCWPYTIFY